MKNSSVSLFNIQKHTHTHHARQSLSVLTVNFLCINETISTCVSSNETTSMDFTELCRELYVMIANLMSETS